MHGLMGGGWRRSVGHGHRGGTACRETAGTQASGPTAGQRHRASRLPSTDASTAPSCTSSHGASTSTWPDGPCTSSNDSAASSFVRCSGCERSTNTSQTCSPTGNSPPSPPAGLWGLDDGRSSRPVLRAAGGENPPADSPSQLGHDRKPVSRLGARIAANEDVAARRSWRISMRLHCTRFISFDGLGRRRDRARSRPSAWLLRAHAAL